MATELRASARRPPWKRVTCERAVLARAAMVPAGRAWRPKGSRTSAVQRNSVRSAGASGATEAGAEAEAISQQGAPRATRPGAARARSPKASPFVSTTGIISEGTAGPMRAASKEIKRSPAATSWPSRTCATKPFPASPTVSMPICISTSAPLRARSVTAWRVGGRLTTSPAKGARSTSPSGSMAKPSPSTRPEKTGSGTASRGTSSPSTGASTATAASAGGTSTRALAPARYRRLRKPMVHLPSRRSPAAARVHTRAGRQGPVPEKPVTASSDPAGRG